MPPEWADNYYEMGNFWRQKLFEWGFPAWLIQGAKERNFNWTFIVPDLFSGQFSTDAFGTVPRFSTESALRKFTALALSEVQEPRERESLRLALQLDGFEIENNELRPLDGPVSVEQEKSRLLASLRQSKLNRKNVISKHIEDAEDHFNQGKHHSAIGEARSALQAVIEETVKLVETATPNRSGSGTKNLIEFLEREHFLSNDEQQAFTAAWVFLSSGNHPGLPPEEDGRIGTILCLEFIQILLAKCRSRPDANA